MKKFFYCIIPFILIWGWYGSLLFVPQLHHEYLGTVESDNIIRTITEYQDDNDYFTICNYRFTYKDKFGTTRSSEDIHINNTFRYIPSRGFNTRSENDWIVKQLIENGKVYAPGWKDWILIAVILSSIAFPIYFFVQSTDHLSCLVNENNYRCGKSDRCFGCPFCVTDQQTICTLKTNLEKPKNEIKEFFGYSS